jgi:type II secretory pathway pseudopilin PulG
VTSRDRAVILIVCVLAAVAGSWLLVIQPKRGQAAKLGDQVNAAQSQLDSARAQVAQGEAAKSSFASSYTKLVRLGEAVPSDDNMPSLIYQLQSAASTTGVDFRSLTLNPAGSGGSPATPEPSSSASAAQAVTAALPPGATVGPAGFPIEPFTFTFRGNFFHVSDFFGRLQRFVIANNQQVSVSGRLMTLNAISLGPGPDGFPQITATIWATTYLVPAAQGLLNGATPGGPATNPSAQAVSTPTTSAAPPSAVASLPVR